MARRNAQPTAEQILNICRANIEPTEKERQLIVIGLQADEARGLVYFSRAATESEPTAIENAINVYTATADEARRILAAYTCGVEIECFARNTELSAAALAEGLVCRAEDYNHDDHADGQFKLVSDGSLGGLPYPTECVSPVLTYCESADKLSRICRALANVDAKVNKTTGLHVHVGAAELTDTQYCSVFINYMFLQGLIDSFMPMSRRNSRWAKRLNTNESRVLLANSKNAMAVALYNDRYYAVNPCAYSRHYTIEFRQHGGTVDYSKIMNWLAFCVKLVDWSKNNRLTADSAPRTIDEIAFLNESEKEYFKRRAAFFAEREAAAA